MPSLNLPLPVVWFHTLALTTCTFDFIPRTDDNSHGFGTNLMNLSWNFCYNPGQYSAQEGPPLLSQPRPHSGKGFAELDPEGLERSFLVLGHTGVLAGPGLLGSHPGPAHPVSRCPPCGAMR